MKATTRIWRLIGWTLVAFLSLLGPVYWLGGIELVKSYSLGYFVSVVNIVSSLLSIQWAFRRNVKTFYAVVLGGMTLRFLLVAGIVFLVIAVLRWPLAGFLLSFVIFYVFLQYHETRYINKELKGIQSAQDDQSNR